MKHRILCFLMLLSLLPCATWAQTFVNLTPRPKTMTVGTGSLNMPTKFTVNYTDLDEDGVNEVKQFVAAYTAVTGAEVNITTGDENALFQVAMLPPANTLKESGYTLNITTNKVEVKGKSALGLFYAFQSVKKMLPANVMAGVKDAKITTYALPVVNITDQPRFDYRGFMLDVSRHFFTVNEVKRMIDVMAAYKMNAFHWHLSDDQGWRVEIKKYPKLTTVGSIAPNSRFTDMEECTQYWINKPYGPYFYTQEEIKDVVAYAKARHIEVIPEIDMPGHFCAAMTAYPEYSCSPNGNHRIWDDGGISSDVMNVANPEAVQFAKDILSELIELFPSQYIHIGGDECPTTAWQGNDECKALYKKLGLTHYRQLQSHFIKQMDEFVKSKGRKLAVWNESISAEGADLNIVKATDATVFCWTNPEAAVDQAKKLGLKSIYTPWGPYYINRRQGNTEKDPPGAGYGTDHVQATYNQNIPANTTYGVQGTFWTEHVSDAEYMEWLALPRLIAIAERGWTPEANKNFSDFQKRMSADTVMLNYGNYKYCKYYMLGTETGGSHNDKVMPFANTADKKYYYRIISGGTDATRVGRCIELLAEGSELITANSGKGAKAGVLWTSPQAAEGATNYDYQWWSIEEDPANPGKYALVCKAQPNGSVNANPTATNTGGRWTYDNNAKHYNFTLGAGAYGKKGNNYYYSLSSDKVNGQYLNSSMAGQGLAVNVYSNPNDGAGGQWEFSPLENYGSTETPVTFDYLVEGKAYTFSNAVEGFEGLALADDNQGNNLKASADLYANNAWIAESVTTNADGSQTLKLKNAVTGRYITDLGNFQSRVGSAANVGASQAEANVTLSLNAKYNDLRVKVAGKSLFPLPAGQVNAGSTISNGADAARNQGSEWTVQQVNVVTFTCVDDLGSALGTYTRSIPASVNEITAEFCPTIKNNSVQNIEATGENAYKVTYKRSAYSVVYNCTTERGAIISSDEIAVPVGEKHKVAVPEHKYFSFKSADATNGEELTLTADRTINAVYTTEATIGVKKDGNVVTKLEANKDYLMYDATTASGRAGYRCVNSSDKYINRVLSAEGQNASIIWNLQGSGNRFKVYNVGEELYVPQLVLSQAVKATRNGETFTFSLNEDGATWKIQGSNNMRWDGSENGSLVGWNQGNGHPIRITTFYAQPMFQITQACSKLDKGDDTFDLTQVLVNAGSAYTFVYPQIEGYTLDHVTGLENFEGTVESNLNVVAYYSPVDAINNVTVDNKAKNKGIYDLQGRRLLRIQQPGLYIINGQKVLVK